jgi:lipopolysaccharide transport system permease protein
MWHYRDLLYILAWRDVKVRYKQALLGAAWAVLQPLVMLGILTLLFSRIATVPTNGTPYPIFALVAIIPWTMFASATAGSGNSLVTNQNLVSKVYFPKLLMPIGAILAWTPDFVIGSIMLLIIMAFSGFEPPVTALLLPIVMVFTVLASLSVGVWLSALNVAYRDVQYVVPFLIQAWLFITPVAYSTASVPKELRWLTALNPLAWVIDISRWALLGTTPSWALVWLSMATTLALLISGLYYFKKVERFFADVI